MKDIIVKLICQLIDNDLLTVKTIFVTFSLIGLDMRNNDINIDVNRLITLEFQDGTVLDVQIVDHKLSKKQDVYLINHESPLAKAILDKRKGDVIRFRSDNKIQEVTILEVIEKPKHFS